MTTKGFHYVIIGNGATANKAAAVIRKADRESRITLISNEFFPYYYRHRLCSYLAGDIEEDELAVIRPEIYKKKKIRLRLGQTVSKIDFAARTLYLAHMEKVRYDKLLIACGGKPKIPEPLRDMAEHFSFLKTLADARRWRRRLAATKRVLMVGGDLISVRVTRALITMGKEVVFMVDRDAFWPLELNDTQHREFTASLVKTGVTVVEDSLAAVTPGAEGYQVRTRGGATIDTGLIGAFFGLVPDIDFLAGSGIDMESGILVNEHLETSVKDVFAAGDCAQIYNPEIRDYWVSIGWHNAKRLGTLAGENMVGGHQRAAAPTAGVFSLGNLKIHTQWWKELTASQT